MMLLVTTSEMVRVWFRVCSFFSIDQCRAASNVGALSDARSRNFSARAGRVATLAAYTHTHTHTPQLDYRLHGSLYI